MRAEVFFCGLDVLYGSGSVSNEHGSATLPKTTADTPLTHGVVAPGIVVGSILLPADQLLGVEELAVGSGSNLVHNRRLQVDKHRPIIEK